MLTLNLYHIQYTQLDPMTWCATAHVSRPILPKNLGLLRKLPLLCISNRFNADNTQLCQFKWDYKVPQAFLPHHRIAYYQRQQQRAGVRLLLQSLLNKLNIIDSLEESSFPYRLINSQYYVCFSHTGANSKNTDTTYRNKKDLDTFDDKVAVIIGRHRPVGIDIEINTVAWHVAQRFYHSKEISILQTLPTLQRNDISKLLWQIKESFIKIQQYKLAQGLGIDYSSLIPYLIDSKKAGSPLIIGTDCNTNCHIALLPSQQAVVVY